MVICERIPCEILAGSGPVKSLSGSSEAEEVVELEEKTGDDANAVISMPVVNALG